MSSCLSPRAVATGRSVAPAGLAQSPLGVGGRTPHPIGGAGAENEVARRDAWECRTGRSRLAAPLLTGQAPEGTCHLCSRREGAPRSRSSLWRGVACHACCEQVETAPTEEARTLPKLWSNSKLHRVEAGARVHRRQRETLTLLLEVRACAKGKAGKAVLPGLAFYM